MNYQNIYDYCKDISQNLGLSVKFVHEDKAWLNAIEPNQGVTCWSLPFSSSFNFNPMITRTWTLSFIFYQQDMPDSSMNQNDTEAQQESIRTLANTDQVMEMFVRLFSSNSISDSLSEASETLEVTTGTTSPAIRDTAQLLTGTFVTLTVQIPDNFDYCCLTDAT